MSGLGRTSRRTRSAPEKWAVSRMGSTRIWAFSAVAPWCLAAGLLVSFAADAGQNTLSGFTVAKNALASPQDLVPAVTGSMAVAFHAEASALGGLVRPASLTIGSPAELQDIPDEIEPRADMKRDFGSLPSIDRTHKGNLFIGLRPSYQTKVPVHGDLAALRRSQAVFGQDLRNPPPSILTQMEDSPSGPEAVAAFEGAVLDPTVTVKTSAPASPPAMASVPTARPVLTATPAPVAQDASATVPRRAVRPVPIATVRANDGSSPIVPRAVSLASMTPTARNSVPVEVDPVLRIPAQTGIGKGRLGAPNLTFVAVNGQITEQPDYRSLIATDKLQGEEQCLAEAIYFEARSEPNEGKAAVAQVVLNRVASGLYPRTICGVVYQNRQYYMACQFSFACEGKSLRITEPASWATAQRIARQVLGGETYMANVGGATHYHAKYVRPYWANTLTRMDTIGQHVFYKMKGGPS